MAPAPLLTLSPERMAREAEHAAAEEAVMRCHRRQRWRMALPWTLLYLDGIYLALNSLHRTGDLARASLWGGLLLGNLGILGYLLQLWLKSQE